MKIILLFLALVAIAYAQIGDYSHFVGGTTTRAGWHRATGYAAWDDGNKRFMDLPAANFDGRVWQIAAAGRGYLAVGEFQTVNGQQAYGIAFFNGTNWCGLNHLNLYYADLPNPLTASGTQPYPFAHGNVRAGSATAIYSRGDNIYIFGGRLTAQRQRFNVVGNNILSNQYAGLIRLTVANGGTNFTLDNSFVFETRPGRLTGQQDNNILRSFPADNMPIVAAGSVVKLRVSGTGNNVFVVAAINGGVPQVWQPSWGAWLDVANGWGLSSVGTTLNVQWTINNALGGVVDYDLDVNSNALLVAGNFNQGGVQFVSKIQLVAASGTTPSITWAASVSFSSNPSFTNTGFSNVVSIAAVSENDYYLAISYAEQSTTTPRRNFNQARIMRANNNQISAAGLYFNRSPQQLVVSNNVVFAFFTTGQAVLYNQNFDLENPSSSRYLRSLSTAIRYDVGANNWDNAFGGWTSDALAELTTVTYNSGVYMIKNTGLRNVFDVHANGLFAYNKKKEVNRWTAAATQRLVLRGPADSGSDGTVHTVHFLKSQPTGVTDGVVVAGSFDWYGTQYLGAVALVRTSNWNWEPLGGGLWNPALDDGSYLQERNPPYLVSGVVYDIEEGNGRLYAGGSFSKNQNGECVSNVAALNHKTGGVWYDLKGGCDNIIYDIFADGDDVYVGGSFTNCGGVSDTRGIAEWDQDDEEWEALGTGVPTGTVYAIQKYRGQLYVGGQFGNALGGTRGSTGLYRFDGDAWHPVYSRCQQFCAQSEYEAPFQSVSSFDPVSRVVGTVKSLRVQGRTLYAAAAKGGSTLLLGYDGAAWRQYGTIAQGNCEKQGCLATNGSRIIAVNFNEVAGSYVANPNYQTWHTGDKNWVEPLNHGFSGGVQFVASASIYSLSLFFAFFLAIIAYLF